MKSILKFCIVSFCCSLVSCKVTSPEVQVEQRNIMVDGEPYLIKGICYHPVPIGSDKRDFSNLRQDMKLMKEAGINTIRVYEPITEEEVLDYIDAVGMKVIMGFGYDQKGVFDIKSGSVIDYVKAYKDHNAILFWELGNEYNYHPKWFENDIANWYRIMERTAQEIKKLDASHPVATAHGELPSDLALSMARSIDVWGMNVYRWDDPKAIFKEWKLMSDKPMYLSEAGGDSYMTITKSGYEKGNNEQAQADANAKILDAVFRNNDICSGVTLFSFTDGWWKAGDNNNQDIGGWAPNSTGVPYDGTPNEEYWGIVDIKRNKKKTFEVVKQKYSQSDFSGSLTSN